MGSPVFDIRPFTSISSQQWDDLWRRSRSPNVFYDHGYLSAILGALPADFHFRQVITLEAAGRLQLVQPVAWQSAGMGKILHLFLPFYGDHVEPLCAAGSRDEYFDGLIEFVSRQSGADLVWGNALSESFANFLLENHQGLRPLVVRRHPVLDLDLPGSMDDFWSLFKSNFRSSLRRRIRAAEKEGAEVRYLETGGEEAVHAQHRSLEVLRDLHRKRWAGRLFGATDFSMPTVQQFHRRFIEQPHGGLLPLFVEILHDGKVVGSNYALCSPETMIFYHHCFDPDYRSFGMGDLLAFYSIEYAVGHKLKRIDFKRGEEVYKTKWTDSKTENVDLLLPLTRKGRMIARQKLLLNQLRENQKLRTLLSWIKATPLLKDAVSGKD